MATDNAVTVDPNFPDACYFPDQDNVLVSFQLTRFFLFLALVVVVGPLSYRFVSWIYDWERDPKSLVEHLQDTADGLVYSFVVFVLGNYSHTLSGWTVLGYFVGLFGWALLGELPYLKVSLPTWRTWSKGAWIVHLLAVVVVVGLAVVHFVWASQQGILWPWYIVGLVLGTAFIWVGAVTSIVERRYVIPWRIRKEHPVYRTQSREIGRRGVHEEYLSSASEDGPSASLVTYPPPIVDRNRIDPLQGSDLPPMEDATPVTNGNCPAIAGTLDTHSLYPESEPPGTISPHDSTTQLAGTPLQPMEIQDEINPSPWRKGRSLWQVIDPWKQFQHRRRVAYTKPLHPCLKQRYGVHLHHWQIFYILAFFTRFPNVLSQICGGLVLGIFTHGGAAYGFDALLEVEGEPVMVTCMYE
ncbi:hypothetical protein IWQ61_008718 [Dispira simplex]|nr:hypothetical protein IWQ61_008718 [Dispira simplex]